MSIRPSGQRTTIPDDVSGIPAAPKRQESLRRILRHFVEFRSRIALYVVVLTASALLQIAVPLLVRRVIDVGLQRQGDRLVIGLAILALALGLAGAGLSAWGGAIGSLIGVDLIYKLRLSIYQHLQSMPVAFYARSQSGAVLSRISTDVLEAQGLVQTLFGSLVTSLIALAAALIAMLSLSPLLAVTVLVVSPLFLIPMRHYGKQTKGVARAQARGGSRLSAFTTERLNVGGAMLRLTLANQAAEFDDYRERADAMRQVVRGRNIVGAKSDFTLGALTATGFALVYLVGGIQVVRGHITVGTLVAMATLVTLAYSPLSRLAGTSVNIQGGLVSFERVFELLDFYPRYTTPIVDGAHKLRRPVDAVDVRDVHFRYPTPAECTLESLLDVSADHQSDAHRVEVLHGISATMTRGTVTAIVGPSGSGKSTTAALLAGMYEPTSGVVLFDGRPMRDYPRAEFRTAIGMVSQDTYLYNASLTENLRAARPNASVDDLAAACRNANLQDLIERLPNGYDTILGDRGFRLSGGERQRIAIARILLSEPDVVILDEATAHLDSRTERAIQSVFDDVAAKRILVVVAHRLSTVQAADQILVMDRGRIVEQGAHDALIDRPGLYRSLYTAWMQ